MRFVDKLAKKKDVMIDNWYLVAMAIYPFEASKFLLKISCKIDNPVGKETFDSLKNIFDGLCDGIKTEKFKPFIDPIMRIRAVQGFEPSEAIRFFFSLKNIVCSHLEINDDQDYNRALFVFCNRIDKLAMLAFDIYMGCRERIYELKANEARSQFFSSLTRAGLIGDS